MYKISNEDIIKKYEELKSCKKVGVFFGVSHEYIRCRLNKLGKIYTRNVSFNSDFFFTDTPESFYWAGFIAADGCLKLVNNKYKVLSIGLSQLDYHHLEKFAKAIEFTGKISTWVGKNSNNSISNNCGISINSEKIFDDLTNRFGIGQRKSLTYNFPRNILNHDFLIHFMRGYFDGDGCFFTNTSKRRNTKQLHFGLRGTNDFLTVYKNILETNCILRKSENKPRFNNGIFMLEYGGTRAVGRIRDFLYTNATSDIWLDRKYNLAHDKMFTDIPEDYKLKPVTSTNILTGQIKCYDSIKDTEKYGFCKVSVSNCCNKKIESHKGCIFTYA